MSVFKDKAIVLKIDKIREKDLLYAIFTYEYWKIRANKKYSNREKNIDLWNIINFEIHTKENVKVHKIKNIKIKSQFDTKKFNDYWILNKYLEVLALIYKELPDWLQNKEVFDIIEYINNFEKIDEIKLILAKIKIKYLFGDVWLQNKNITVKKILYFVSKNHIKDIFRLNWINNDIKEELDKI